MNKYDDPLNIDTENSRELVIEQIRPNSQVLEFGPATGQMTRYLKQVLNCNVYIVEIDEEAFGIASQYAKDGLLGDIEDYKWLEKFKNVKFDYIIFTDVLEHLVNPKEVLIKSKELLALGGRIITSIPNIAHNSVIIDLINNKFSYSQTGILDSTHLRFFTYYSLQQLFDDCGLTIIDEKMVRVDLEQFGLKNALYDISKEQMELLKKRDFAFAYQFVFTSIEKSFYIKHMDEIVINKCNKEDAKGVNITQKLFIDRGAGFSENSKIMVRNVLDDTKFNININLSNEADIVGLRFDPCEYPCRIKINSVTSNLEELRITAQNATIKETDYDVFMHDDPIYILSSNNINNIKYLGINGEIIGINVFELQMYYYNLLQKLQADEINLRTGLNKQINELIKQKTEKDNKIILLSNEIIGKDKTIAVLNDELCKKDTDIISLREENNAKNERINLLNNKINKKDNEIIKLNKEIQDKAEQLQVLNEKIQATTEELESLSIETSRLNEIINNNNLYINQLIQNYNQLTNINVQKDQDAGKILNEMLVIQNERDIISKQLNNVYNSFSWRITKPLRSALLFAKKVKSHLITKSIELTETKMILTEPYSENNYYDASVSIVIPVYNGGVYLRPLFEIIRKQKGIKSVEIVIVDSGSTDDTIKICEEYKVNLIRITQSEFSHSYARNLGASKANGDYIIFMTQDALPSNEYWVYNMLTPIIKHNVVAVSCREKVRNNCELAYHIESENFATFLGIYDSDRICSLPKLQNYETLRKNGQLNDVSCAIVKSVFNQFKYAGDFAEDLDLGVRLIKAGYNIALISSEVVIHSHNRSCGYYLKRAIVDSKNLIKMFPDFPYYIDTGDNIVNSTIYAYYKIICTLDYIKQQDKELSTEEFIGQIQNYINSISSIKIIPKKVIPYGRIYSDAVIDDYIRKLTKIYDNETVDKAFILDHVVHYINSIAKFIYQHYTVVDSELKDQIIDAIYKRFASISGNFLSLYVTMNPHDTALRLLVEELQKGV